MNFIRDSKEKARDLSSECKRTDDISKGKGFMGWIHKKIIKDCEKYNKRNKEIIREMKKFSKEVKLKMREFKKKNLCPHLSKAKLKFDVVIKKEK